MTVILVLAGIAALYLLVGCAVFACVWWPPQEYLAMWQEMLLTVVLWPLVVIVATVGDIEWEDL